MSLSNVIFTLASATACMEDVFMSGGMTVWQRIQIWMMTQQNWVLLFCFIPALCFYVQHFCKVVKWLWTCLRWVRRKFLQWKPVKKISQEPIDMSPDWTSTESMILGSALRTTKEIPDSQVFLYNTAGEALGCGFRYQQWLITPKHVVLEAAEVLIAKTIDGPRRLKKLDEVVELEADLVAYKDVKLFSELGVKSARFSPLETAQAVVITGMYEKNNQSVGFLESGPAAGHVQYTGSTIRGFSGALYMAGPHVMGMHTNGAHASQPNYGYAGTYIRTLLEIETRQEATYGSAFDERENQKVEVIRRGGKMIASSRGVFREIDEQTYDRLKQDQNTDVYNDVFREKKVVPVEQRTVNPKRVMRDWNEMNEEDDSWEGMRPRRQLTQTQQESFLASGRSANKSAASHAVQHRVAAIQKSNNILQNSGNPSTSTNTNGCRNTLTRGQKRAAKREGMRRQLSSLEEQLKQVRSSGVLNSNPQAETTM